jgi:HTH-type transcriptional regulator/antitoxin HigA
MRPIKTEKQYRDAVARIDTLAVAPDAEDNEELELLTILVMAYETEHVPDVAVEPLEYLKASMANRGLTQSDLSALLGSSSRAAEVLKGKRTFPRLRSARSSRNGGSTPTR